MPSNSASNGTSSDSGVAMDGTMDISAPPTLSAAVVIQQYKTEQQMKRQDTTQAMRQRSPGAQPLLLPQAPSQPHHHRHPQQQQQQGHEAYSDRAGKDTVDVNEESLPKSDRVVVVSSEESSPCSSDGCTTTTTTTTTTAARSNTSEAPHSEGPQQQQQQQQQQQPVSLAMAEGVTVVAAKSTAARPSQQPVLSSPATTTPTSATLGRKPMLSGRSRQLKLQAASLGGAHITSSTATLDETSAREGGCEARLLVPRTPTSAAVGVGGPALSRPSSSAVFLATANSSVSSTPRCLSFSNGNKSTANGIPGNVNLVKPASLSRPSSTGSASFRRHYHLSSIAGCNYGQNATGNTSSIPVSPALSTVSTGSTRPVLGSARHTFQRTTMPAHIASSSHDNNNDIDSSGTSATSGGGASSAVTPLLRQEYRAMQKNLLAAATTKPSAGPADMAGLLPENSNNKSSAGDRNVLPSRLPATNAPAAFQHRKKKSCPLHSKAGRAAEEQRQEAMRLRLLQQQHHDEQIISNGGREAVDPTLKSSAKIAGLSSKLLQRTRSRRGSFTAAGSGSGGGGGDHVTISAFSSRPPSPEGSSVKESRDAGGSGSPPSACGMTVPALVQNGFFNSPPTLAPDEMSAVVVVGGASDGDGPYVDDSPARPLARNAFGSSANINRNGLKGEVIVAQLQRERSSASSSGSSSSSSSALSSPARSARSTSPPLFISPKATQDRKPVSAGSYRGQSNSAAGKHKINYHEATSPSPYRGSRKNGAGVWHGDSDGSDSDECIFSFQKQRQSKVRRTPLAAASLSLSGAAALPSDRIPAAVAATTPPPALPLVMKEETSASESLAGSLILPSGKENKGKGSTEPASHRPSSSSSARASARAAEARNTDGDAEEEDDGEDEECCYCCPCRRPENFFLLCQGSSTTLAPASARQRKDSRPNLAITVSNTSESQPFTPVGLPASPTQRGGNTMSADHAKSTTVVNIVEVEEPESAAGVAEARGLLSSSSGSSSRSCVPRDPSRRDGAEDDDDGPLLTVASFRRSSVRRVSSH